MALISSVHFIGGFLNLNRLPIHRLVLLVSAYGRETLPPASPRGALGRDDVPTVGEGQQLELGAGRALEHHAGRKGTNVAHPHHGSFDRYQSAVDVVAEVFQLGIVLESGESTV